MLGFANLAKSLNFSYTLKYFLCRFRYGIKVIDDPFNKIYHIYFLLNSWLSVLFVP